MPVFSGCSFDPVVLRYDANGASGGSVPTASVSYLPGDEVTIAEAGDLTRDGYIFAGWNTLANGEGGLFLPGTSLVLGSGTIVLHAQWTPVHRLTYDANGATGDVPVDVRSYESHEEAVVAGSGNLTKTGYLFGGWTTNSDGGEHFDSDEIIVLVDGGITLFARWIPLFPLTYDANGATDGEAPLDTAVYGMDSSAVVSNQGTLSNPGFHFFGWNTAEDGSEAAYEPGDSILIPDDGIVLYAQWNPTLTISYRANGSSDGLPPDDATVFAVGDTAVVAHQGELIRTGFRFLNWNTAQDGNLTDYEPGDFIEIPETGILLYAQWEPVYTLSYHPNGATNGETPVDSKKYVADQETIALSQGTLTRSEYEFSGWNEAEDGSSLSYMPGEVVSVPSEGLTLYAQWEQALSVSYFANGATGTGNVDSAIYQTGDIVTVLSTGTLQKGDSQFCGWNTSTYGAGETYQPGETFVIGDHNVTLYAFWAQGEFITLWETDYSDETGDNTITLPFSGSFSSILVDWGDGTSEYLSSLTHTYLLPGTYTVTASGNFEFVPALGNKEKLMEISQWGPTRIPSMFGVFQNCINLEITAEDTPVFSVTTMDRMFLNCDNLTGAASLPQWDTSVVTSMQSTFEDTDIFNTDLSAWDTIAVTNMESMFHGAISYNQDLSAWNTSAVTTMKYMFKNAAVFNGSLSSWNTSSVVNMDYMFNDAVSFNQDLTSWNTSNVTSMKGMFSDAVSFNGDVSTWDTSSVTDMDYMFNGALAFDQDLSAWDITNVAEMTLMFFGSGLSVENYSAILMGWAEQDIQHANLLVVQIQYTEDAAAARQKLIDDFGWTIIDDGQVP